MAPKKAAGAAAAATKKTATASAHGSYRAMIKEAIIQLKERNGSSRQAIKKYVKANNKVSVTSESQFDSLFNKALRTGVEKGEFTQPKGTSGPVKLAKKEAKPVEKKTAAPKKETKEAKPKATTKKTATKTETKTTTTKKAPATKKTATKAKTKANTAKPRAKATKTDAPAPAVTDTPTVLKKTKSGRVSKQKATTAKKPATKKAAPKKATAKKTEAS